MVPTPRTNKVQEVAGSPCKNLQIEVKMQSQQLLANRMENMDTPNLKGRTAFIPRQRLVTPLISNTLNHLISSVENSQRKSEKPISPNLEMLRMTPGLQQKQKILQEKHLKAKSSLDKIPVGGGVSLWPDMDDMRLTKREVLVLTISSLLLIFAVVTLFEYLHGKEFTIKEAKLFLPLQDGERLGKELSATAIFPAILVLLGVDNDNIQQQFEVPFCCVHATFILYIMFYVAGITVLLYYLVDNMIQKSRLTPKRIKTWLTLLVVTASWTFLMIKLLVAAHHLEREIEGTVYTLIEELADLAATGHDLRCYHDIVTYWQFRCLPPTTRGILKIFGIIKVHDISFYFHYYSLPVITALCTPIIKLLLALKTIYSRPRVC